MSRRRVTAKELVFFEKQILPYKKKIQKQQIKNLNKS
jgi:hypothetical protein